ncbi:uncharacterized protein KD926_008475 [Aspergillus affinis]|uniref:uncharacterized protein n=1 Tax=Aspergillus affinis TaxID=1070780 RepID=UPI0022FF1F62|nr:uncharacterized protein KD926_008475 [Aspergillus affinis]KAI9040274.1 hypothetical protein KD926_008475 [Aspergillus affinis]
MRLLFSMKRGQRLGDDVLKPFAPGPPAAAEQPEARGYFGANCDEDRDPKEHRALEFGPTVQQAMSDNRQLLRL